MRRRVAQGVSLANWLKENPFTTEGAEGHRGKDTATAYIDGVYQPYRRRSVIGDVRFPDG